MALTTFREIQRRVQQRIVNSDTSTSNADDLLPKIKVWINERYEQALSTKPWEALTKSTTLAIVASQRSYALDRDILQLIDVYDSTNGIKIKEITANEYVRDRATSLDVTANILTAAPTHFYQVGKYTVKGETGSTAEKVSVVSSSASDVSPLQVYIRGLVSGVEISESINLTGTSAVTSTNTYDASQKLHISIGSNDINTEPILNGVVTASGNTSSTVLTKIAPFDLATEYNWIDVSPLPTSEATQPTWTIWYRRKYPRMINDNDMPIIDISRALVYGAYADALREDGQEQEANLADGKFVGLVEEVYSTTQNPNRIDQFVPESREVGAIDEYSRYISY